MANKIKDVNEELVGAVKSFFLKNDYSMSQISEMSEELFGVHIPAQSLKNWSSKDTEGHWSLLKITKGRTTEEVSAHEKLTMVADLLWSAMMDPDSGISARELPAFARAWYEIFSKARLDKDISVKTSREQALEWLKEVTDEDI